MIKLHLKTFSALFIIVVSAAEMNLVNKLSRRSESMYFLKIKRWPAEVNFNSNHIGLNDFDQDHNFFSIHYSVDGRSIKTQKLE